MALIAIDTCFGACSVAIARDGRIVASRYEERRTGHAEAIVPMIAEVLGEARIEPSALQKIAVTRGPGTFAGMRIGLAAAEGLKLATGAVIVPASSLWAIGQRVLAEHGPQRASLAIAVDAGRGQVYFELLTPEGQPATKGPELLSIDDAKVRAARADAAAFGSGAAHIAASVSAAPIEPDAARFALAALDLPDTTGPVAPLYFRPADAVVQSPPAVLR